MQGVRFCSAVAAKMNIAALLYNGAAAATESNTSPNRSAEPFSAKCPPGLASVYIARLIELFRFLDMYSCNRPRVFIRNDGATQKMFPNYVRSLNEISSVDTEMLVLCLPVVAPQRMIQHARPPGSESGYWLNDEDHQNRGVSRTALRSLRRSRKSSNCENGPHQMRNRNQRLSSCNVSFLTMMTNAKSMHLYAY
jgi:hypothetical protein